MKNRDRWTITNINPDGSISAARTDNSHETVRLPSNYVQRHVELGYAQTSHAAQGRTVDHALLVLDTPTNSPGIYVALTRGRHSNVAYITAPDHPTALNTLATAITNQWIDQPARVRQSDLALSPRLPGQLPQAEIDRLRQRQDQLAKAIDHAGPELGRARRELRDLNAGRPRIVEKLSTTQDQLREAKTTLDTYDRPLHRRKHRTAVDNAKSDIELLPSRITGLEHDLAQTDQAVPRLTAHISQLEAHKVRLPDLSNEYDDNTRRLEHDQGVYGPTRSEPTVGYEVVDGVARPRNQDLIDALDELQLNRPGGPDLGISL